MGDKMIPFHRPEAQGHRAAPTGIPSFIAYAESGPGPSKQLRRRLLSLPDSWGEEGRDMEQVQAEDG